MSEFLTGFFVQIWRIFQMPCGLFDLTFADILLGGFVVVVSIQIIKGSFDIAGSVYKQDRRESFWRKHYERKN